MSFLSIKLFVKNEVQIVLTIWEYLSQWWVENINNHSGIYSRNRNFCNFGLLDGLKIQLKSSG